MIKFPKNQPPIVLVDMHTVGVYVDPNLLVAITIKNKNHISPAQKNII